jgi:hypothetical protein
MIALCHSQSKVDPCHYGQLDELSNSNLRLDTVRFLGRGKHHRRFAQPQIAKSSAKWPKNDFQNRISDPSNRHQNNVAYQGTGFPIE